MILDTSAVSKLCYSHDSNDSYLVGGLEHVLLFHLLGIIIPIDFHIFQRDRSTTNQLLELQLLIPRSSTVRPSAHSMCAHLCVHPELVRGKRVVELGVVLSSLPGPTDPLRVSSHGCHTSTSQMRCRHWAGWLGVRRLGGFRSGAPSTGEVLLRIGTYYTYALCAAGTD